MSRLGEPTTVHWHGLELESVHDGVAGWSRTGSRVAPLIAPGDSFVVTIIKPRAGTFIYHTHMDETDQLVQGMSGPFLALEPGERFEPEDLVSDDLSWSIPMDDRYEVNLSVTVAGQTVEITRGFASVDVVVKGLPYRVETTHLEPADDAGVLIPPLEPIQLAQAAELLGFAASSPIPVIVTGDLNTNAGDGTRTRTYQMVTDAGFVDAWLVGRPRGDGFTANQAPDLLNPVSQLFHRIDFVFIGEELVNPQGRFRGAVHAERVGEEQSDRTPSGLWPSDHAA